MLHLLLSVRKCISVKFSDICRTAELNLSTTDTFIKYPCHCPVLCLILMHSYHTR